MFYSIPTKRGLGIEIWGSYDDIKTLYEVVGKFWNDERYADKKGAQNRDELISGFSYELRKAFGGSRLKKGHSHFSFEKVQHFGCAISWVHVIFSLAALRQNMRYIEANKYDIGTFLQFEFWIEKAMYTYDEEGAKSLAPYLEEGVYRENANLYQFMRSINIDYFNLGGGKDAFRKLPEMLRKAVYKTREYRAYSRHLTQEAKRLQCDISELELTEDDKIYEIEW